MPIQWSGLLSSPEQLARVIQGESATPAGQFAVASVIYNRLNSTGPFVGSGTGDLARVVTPTQFNGYSSGPPSAYATQLAEALYRGEAPPGGTTGNALFFAAPRADNAAWANPATASGQGLFANGANIGGNYYTDRFGPPSAGFVAPQFGGSADAQGGTIAPLPTTAPASDPTNGSPYVGSPFYSSDTTSGTPYYGPSLTDTSTASINQSSQVGYNALVKAAGVSGVNNTAQIIPSLNVQQAIDQQTRILIANTNATNQTNTKVAQSEAQAIAGASKSLTAAAQLISQTAKNLTDKTSSGTKNLFTRGTIIILGIVFVVGGIWLFNHQEYIPQGIKKAAA